MNFLRHHLLSNPFLYPQTVTCPIKPLKAATDDKLTGARDSGSFLGRTLPILGHVSFPEKLEQMHSLLPVLWVFLLLQFFLPGIPMVLSWTHTLFGLCRFYPFISAFIWKLSTEKVWKSFCSHSF
eukprot:EG_transcript_39119